MDEFAAFCARREVALRRALSTAYGPQVGVDAAAEAMAYAWQHRARVLAMANPGGYLYRVGQTAAARMRRPGPAFAVAEPSTSGEPPDVEPRLVALLEALTEP